MEISQTSSIRGAPALISAICSLEEQAVHTLKSLSALLDDGNSVRIIVIDHVDHCRLGTVQSRIKLLTCPIKSVGIVKEVGDVVGKSQRVPVFVTARPLHN